MKEKKNVLLKLTILALIIAAIFGTINAVWYFGYKKTYDDFAKVMEELSSEAKKGNDFEIISDDCICRLNMPKYLGSGGSLTVHKAEKIQYQFDEKGNLINGDEKTVILHIWPQKFGGYKYGVTVMNPLTTQQIEIYPDGSIVPQENGNTELDESNQATIEIYREEILHYIDVAHTLWGIQ